MSPDGVDAMDKDRITGAAKDIAGQVEGAAGDITGDADTQASGRMREAAGKVQNLYGQAKDAARDATDAATGYARRVYRQSGDGTEAVSRMVQENPVGSLLLAGGIGFALAALLLRQPPRRPERRWHYY
jgi:uncharacterized protein YjbJ (UPF0337 family)